MSRTVAYIGPDLSSARVAREGAAASLIWRPAPLGEAEESTQSVLARIADAAAWCAEQARPEDRIDVMCVGVEHATCAWISAPSAEQQVIAAAVRQREQDWGVGAGATVQPLVAPGSAGPRPTVLSRLRRSRARTKGPTRASRVTVLRMRDGMARLLLDDLDRRGLRVSAVCTLWHAIARAWGGGAGDSAQAVTCAALVEAGGSITWAWARGGALLAGGLVALPAQPTASESADAGEPSRTTAARDPIADAGRLALDWLTWSAQLGVRPDRLILIGAEVEALAGSLSRVWPATPCEARSEPDPLGATLARLALPIEDSATTTNDPRAHLVELGARPGREHRRLYTWAAAAIAMLAVGVAGLGHQARAWGGRARERAAEVTAQLHEEMDAIDPRLKDDQFPLRALSGILTRLQKENPHVTDPPPPKPILDELVRLAEQFKALQGEEGAMIDRFQIASDQASANVRVRTLGAGEAVRNGLIASPGKVRWTGRMDGQPPSVNLTLTGDWEASR